VAFVQYHPERELGNDTAHLHDDLINTLRRGIWFERRLYGSSVSFSAVHDGALKTKPSRSRVQNVSTTGTVDSQRIRTNLTIRVTKVVFSAAASSGNPNEASAGQQPNSFAALHISGRVAAENAHVKMSAFHTLDIEVGRDIRIEKDEWDSIALATVEESCVPGRGAEVGAIVCGEGQSPSIHPSDSHRKPLIRHGGVLSTLATYDGRQTEDRCLDPEENVVLFIRPREGTGSILRRRLHHLLEANTLRFRFASSHRYRQPGLGQG